jgi:hypothetical protein
MRWSANSWSAFLTDASGAIVRTFWLGLDRRIWATVLMRYPHMDWTTMSVIFAQTGSTRLLDFPSVSGRELR